MCTLGQFCTVRLVFGHFSGGSFTDFLRQCVLSDISLQFVLFFGHFRQISDSTVQFRTLLSNLELSSDFGGFRHMELGRQVVSEKSCSWTPDYDVSNVE